MSPWTASILIACWVAWAVLWLVMSLRVKRTVERPANAWLVGLVAGCAVAFGLVRAIAGHRLMDRVVPRSVAIQLLAVLLVAAGLAFCAWARVTLGGNWSGSVVFKEDHELIQRGPYGLARHPIYTGLLAMSLGTALAYGRLYGLVVLPIFVVSFVFKARREEQLMVEHFPDQYPAYRTRVKALVPFVF